MLFALTNASLDITLGVTWWTIKQMLSGMMYFGSYLMSESETSKKNKILGDDPNFVPHAFPLVTLEVVHSHTTLYKPETPEPQEIDDDFVEISKTESILTTKNAYYKIPIIEIVRRKQMLPLWFIAFLNTYPLANYSIVSCNGYLTKCIDTPIFSPFTLNKHLEINTTVSDQLCIYLNQEDVENTIHHLLIFTGK